MNTAELKNQLHKLIVETEDIDVLTKIQTYISKPKTQNRDWWNQLNDTTKKEIEEGLKQADKDELIDHEEARKRIDKILEPTPTGQEFKK